MNKIFLFLFLMTSNLFAEELIQCNPNRACNCPVASHMPLPSGFHAGGGLSGAFMICRPVVLDVNGLVKGVNQPLVCEDGTRITNTLFDQMDAIDPQNCGYELEPEFDVPAYRETVSRFLRDGTILCDRARHHSNCVSATFLAFLKHAKKLREQGRISSETLMQWSSLSNSAWQLSSVRARPDLMMSELRVGNSRLGTSTVLRGNTLSGSGSWPREGDIVQINRSNGSGHSTVFAGYLKSSTGQTTGVCYWSSNRGTNGYGKQCESLQRINNMIVARFNP